MFRPLAGALCATLMLPSLAQAATVVPVFGIVTDHLTFSSPPYGASLTLGDDRFTGVVEDLAVAHAGSTDTRPTTPTKVDYRSDVSAEWDSETEGSVAFDTSFTATLGGATGRANVGGTWAYIFEIDGAETITIDYATAGAGAYSSTPKMEIYLSNDETWDDIYRLVVTGTGSLTFNLPGAGRYQFAALNAGWGGIASLTGPGVTSGSQTASLHWRIGESTAPEPSTWAILLLGFGGVGAMLRLQRAGSRALA